VYLEMRGWGRREGRSVGETNGVVCVNVSERERERRSISSALVLVAFQP
jgi:hypothetical protein